MRLKTLFGLLAAIAVGIATSPVLAQSTATPVLPGVLVNSGCAPAQTYCWQPYSVTNPLPITGNITASLGAFQPAGTYATLAVTTSSARVALPAGADVIIYNTGSAVAYVQEGSGSVVATTSNDAVQPGGWVEFATGTNVDLAAITSTGSTSLVISGGAGLASGVGGTSSGGGGGGTSSTFGATFPTTGTAAGMSQGGNMVALTGTSNNLNVNIAAGSIANTSFAVTQATAASLNATVVGTGTLSVQNTAATPAGTNLMGKVGIDETTPGTTNNVSISGLNPASSQQQLKVGTNGGILPAQAVPTTTRTTLTASTATAIDTTRSTRVAIEVQSETTLTANLYLCFSQTTSCSATVYDKLIPSGATSGVLYTAPFGMTNAVYAYTTQSSVVLTSASWLPQ